MRIRPSGRVARHVFGLSRFGAAGPRGCAGAGAPAASAGVARGVAAAAWPSTWCGKPALRCGRAAGAQRGAAVVAGMP